MEGEEEKQDTRWPREGGIAWRHGLATLVARWPTRSQSVRHYHESPPLCDQGHFCEALDIKHGVENEMKRWWIFVVNSKRQSEAIKKKVRMLVFCDFFSICLHFLQILETLKLKNVSSSVPCAASILVCISILLFWNPSLLLSPVSYCVHSSWTKGVVQIFSIFFILAGKVEEETSLTQMPIKYL